MPGPFPKSAMSVPTREGAAAAVESAVDRALAGGLRTADLGGSATTAEATEAVLKEIS